MKETDLQKLNEQLLELLTKKPAFSKIYSIDGKSYSGINVLRLWVAQRQLQEAKDATPKDNQNDVAVWGTFRKWREQNSPVNKGEQSPATIIWNKREQATDKYGNLLFSWGGAPIWNWSAFKYPVFHCSQVKGFREAEFIQKRDNYQKKLIDDFERKQEEAKVQKSDFVGWAETQSSPRHLWSILQQFSVIDKCPIYYFKKEEYPNYLGVYKPSRHTIGLRRDLKSFKRGGIEGSKNWENDEATDLEVLTHEMVHAVARQTSVKNHDYWSADGEANEELVAYFGTVLFFQMFGITHSGFLCGLWNRNADNYVWTLKEIFGDHVEAGYDIIKDANQRVNHILKTVFEKRYGLDKPTPEKKIEIKEEEDVLA